MGFNKKLGHFSNAVNNHPLASKHKLRAYFNFLKWQLSQTVKPGVRKISFVGTTSLLVKKGMTGATGNIYFGLHEFEEMSFLLHFLHPADTFYDVGANIGSYTILAAGVCGAKVCAFEPAPNTFYFLKENVSANKLEQFVTPYMVAVGAVTGHIKITKDFDTVNHVLDTTEANQNVGIDVPIVSLDSVTDRDFPSLIKIDVEGYETEVLNGMNVILKEPTLKAIIIELNGSGNRYGYNENLIHEKLLKHDFLPYTYDGFNRKLIQLDQYRNSNTIYIRDIEIVQQRLKNAPLVKLFNTSF